MTPEQQIERVRQICLTFPETVERPSHGEPTFFVRGKKVFAMFANNHHGDGRIAVWLPASPGLQEVLVETQPETFFKPPYVGVRGWIGIELNQISDEDLQFYIRSGWFLIAPKKLQAQFNETQ
ncbi:MAG: MmcQ/YjbR family DNA-binding protein [Ardenticatenaceae bacterium]|nr:MmcQ/YjbR family DNA-binding protein [Ardenticatenaceae bacterium]